MRKSAKLQKLADESLKKYENDEFLQELKKQADTARQTKRSKPASKWLYPVLATASVLVSVFVCVFFTAPVLPHGESPFVGYSQDDMFSTEADITEINSGCSYISFNSCYENKTSKFYDAKSNDLLYYNLIFINEDTLEKITLFIVVNNDYNFKWEYNDLAVSANVKGFNVNYKELLNTTDLFYAVSSYGKIETENEKIYIEYSGTSMTSESNFIPFLNSVLAD